MTPPTDNTADRINHVSDALEDAVYLLDNVPQDFVAASCTLLPPPDPSSDTSEQRTAASAKPQDKLKAG